MATEAYKFQVEKADYIKNVDMNITLDRTVSYQKKVRSEDGEESLKNVPEDEVPEEIKKYDISITIIEG